MKSSKDIIGLLIKNNHSFSSLLNHICYKEFLKVLPPRFQKAIAFMKIKNSQLLIALKHPGFKMELNYNKDVIKTLLSSFAKTKKECSFLAKIKSIVIFHSKFYPIENKKALSSIPYLPEKATGEFKINVKDEDIKKSLLEIKSLIKELK